jgi:uncharacterized membrane protein
MNDLFAPLALACAAIAVAGVFVNFILVAIHFADLPDQVPRHYRITGRPNAWGSKRFMWVYPAIPLLMLIALTGVTFTSAGKLTHDELRASLRNMSLMAAFLSVLSLALTVRTFAVAEKRAEGLGRPFFPILLAALVAVMFFLSRK